MGINDKLRIIEVSRQIWTCPMGSAQPLGRVRWEARKLTAAQESPGTTRYESFVSRQDGKDNCLTRTEKLSDLPCRPDQHSALTSRTVAGDEGKRRSVTVTTRGDWQTQ
jgi:hypothetical protein